MNDMKSLGILDSMIPKTRTVDNQERPPGSAEPRPSGQAQWVTRAVPRGHFTPCIRRWIKGATRNSATPEPTRAQNPKV